MFPGAHPRRAVAALIGLLLGRALALPAAHAEGIAVYEVEGEADASGSEPRVAALDEAFARAIEQALSDVVDPETRRAHKAAINEHILGRARLWIARFAV